MGQADSRVGGVDSLATGAGRVEDVDAQVRLRNVDVVGLLDDGEHLDTSEGGLTTSLVVKGADTHQTVSTLFD